jgi:hypothetical protein
MHGDGKGFERWLKAQRKKPSTGDEQSNRYLDAATRPDHEEGAHQVRTGESWGVALSWAELGDDAVYAAYISELDSSTARRRVEANVRQRLAEREQKVLADCRRYGLPLPRDAEHLRPMLRPYGY